MRMVSWHHFQPLGHPEGVVMLGDLRNLTHGIAQGCRDKNHLLIYRCKSTHHHTTRPRADIMTQERELSKYEISASYDTHTLPVRAGEQALQLASGCCQMSTDGGDKHNVGCLSHQSGWAKVSKLICSSPAKIRLKLQTWEQFIHYIGLPCMKCKLVPMIHGLLK